jgi:hypothetical protein
MAVPSWPVPVPPLPAPVPAVPEAGTWAQLLGGLAVLGVIIRRRAR